MIVMITLFKRFNGFSRAQLLYGLRRLQIQLSHSKSNQMLVFRTRATLVEDECSRHCTDNTLYIKLSNDRSIPSSSRRSSLFLSHILYRVSRKFSSCRTRCTSMEKALPQIPVKLNNKQTNWMTAYRVRIVAPFHFLGGNFDG